MDGCGGELKSLRELNGEIERLRLMQFDGDDSLDERIAALEQQAAEAMRAEANKTLVPLREAIDLARARARELLGK